MKSIRGNYWRLVKNVSKNLPLGPQTDGSATLRRLKIGPRTRVVVSALVVLSLFCSGTLWYLSDGVFIFGTGSNIGTYRAGQRFHHSVRIVNLTGKYVPISSYPTCGCTNIPVLDATASPFSYVDIPMEFQVGQGKPKLNTRRVLIVYKVGDRYHLVTRNIYFRLAN